MQANQLTNINRSVSCRLFSFFLSLLMIMSLIPESVFFVSSEANDGGFNLSLSWYKNDDPENYVYDSDSRENRMIRLKVSYDNISVSKGYAPGELVVTVPGLKDAIRSYKSYIPIAVAADKASDTEKKYDWNYTYSEAADTFTFTNNIKIDEKTTFEGSFEIVWQIPSDKSLNDFSKTLKAELHTARGEETESNVISYSQSRERDEYRIEEESSRLIDAIGLQVPEGTELNDYIWVRNEIKRLIVKKARAVDDGKEKRFDCYFPEGAFVQGGGLVKQEGKTKIIDGKTYECWSVVTDDDKLEKVFAAYPKDKYEGQTVKNYVEYWGTYLDESEQVLLADTEFQKNLNDYGFDDPPKDIYDVEKRSIGDRSKSFFLKHCDQCRNIGAINAVDFVNGTYTYSSYFNIELNYLNDEETNEPVYDSYNLEFVDDIMDAVLKDGSFKQLQDDEYHFTEVVIPSNTHIKNHNLSIQADKYNVDLYLRHKGGTFEDTPFHTTKISSKSQRIELPDDTVGFKLIIRDVSETFYTSEIKCSYVFHSDDSQIDTDGGSVVNNMYFKLYGKKDDSDYEWCNDIFGREHYSSEREYNRDIELYGSALDRECAQLHILEVPNEFRVSNNLEKVSETKNTFNFSGEIKASFNLGEGSELSKFSLYTIVPEGLSLSELYNTPEKLADVLKFASSNGLPSAYIEEHTKIEIIKDYKGSGRDYIAFHFDFSDKSITPKDITVSGIPMFTYKDDIVSVQASYTMRAGMLIDQDGKWYSASYDDNGMEDNIWVDMDSDGDESETASFSYSTVTINNPEETRLQLIKFVKTSRTYGYVNPDVTEASAETFSNDEYSYRLRANVGSLSVKNLIFFDAIETAEGYKWQGEFVRVDYSYAKKLLKAEPTIYYSTEKKDFASADGLKGDGWTTTQPSPNQVRSIAVDFGDAIADAGSVIYIDVIMKAPKDADNAPYEKLTVNNCLIDYDKVNGDHESLPSNDVCVKFTHKKGKLTLVKRDATDNSVITGAKFELYKVNDDDTEERIGEYEVGDSGKISVDNLLYGKYYFKEIIPPKGYELSAQKVEAVLDDDHPNVRVNFSNTRKTGQFTIQKVSDRLSEVGLEGAEFSVYKSDGTLIQSDIDHITDENGKLTINNLEWGDYYLVETKAPKGYVLSDKKIEFTINAANDAGRDMETYDVQLTDQNGEEIKAEKINNEQIPASAVLTKYEILEDGTETANPLKGAVYELYNSNDKKLGTYMTDKNGKIYADDLTFGNYYFIETVAAKGYEKYSERIEFTVSADHTSEALQVKTTDKRKVGSIWMQKLDDKGEYVKGAVYALFDADTNKQIGVDRKPSSVSFTTSGEGIIEIEGLYWGNYYLKEIESPKGYELNNEEYHFSINKDTVLNTILINAVDNRMKGSVELIKCAENDESVLLPGAKFTLYNVDGSIYRDNLITDDNGKLLVENLDWGSYYFLEKEAPNGYSLNSQKVRFSVNYLTAGKTQHLTVTDPLENYDLKAAKRIKISDIVFAHGDPTFIFKVDGTDNSGVSHTYFKAITFSEEYVNSYKNTNPDADYVDAEVTFIVPAGTYTVTEVETNRYEFEKVEIASGNGTAYNSQQKAVFTLDNANKSGKAAFTNKKTDQSGTSHTSMVTNIINREHKFTAIVADYKGPHTIITSEIDRTKLDVYAVYDDGEQIKLADDAYTINPETFSFENNGEYDVEISYTEGGVVRKDSFSVNIDLPTPFTAKFVTKGADGTYINSDNPVEYTDADGTTYKSLVKITGYLGASSIINFPATLKGYIPTGGTIDNLQYPGEKFKVVAIGSVYNSTPIAGIYGKKGITFAEGIEEISDKAFVNADYFECELILPNSLKRIGNQAFQSCSKLNGLLTIPDSVETIGNYAFYYCGFTGSLTIPSNVKSIGNEAFRGCKFNDRLIFETTNGETKCETIGTHAFWNVSFTGDLIIPEGVKTIGDEAFLSDNSARTVSFENGIIKLPDTLETIGNYAFKMCEFEGGLTIPDSVTSIGVEAFRECKNLNGNLVIGNNVQKIGSHAFWQCENLTGKLIIPDSLKKIEAQTFSKCYKLEGLDLGAVEEIGGRAFYQCRGMKGTLTIPSTVNKISEDPEDYWHGAFSECSGFDSLVIENGISYIGNYTFSECSGLKGNLTIPNSVTTLGQGAFYNCSNLDGYLTLPSDITVIKPSTFNGCRKLRLQDGLTISKKITEIGDRAFNDCNAFDGSVLTIPKGNSLTKIGEYAFSQCKFNSSQSQIWIAVNSQDTDKTADVLVTDNVNAPANTSTHATTVGEEICNGYQVPYGFFQRN